MGLNKCFFIGNLTRGPELAYTKSGTAVCNTTIAVDTGFGDNKYTEFVRLVFWAKKAEVLKEYCQKGRQLHVECRAQTRQWEDKDGNQRYTTEYHVIDFQMLGGREQGSAPRQQSQQAGGYEPDDDFPY